MSADDSVKAGFQWGHVNLNVSDLERSIAFYRLFGFEEFLPGIPYLNLSVGKEAEEITPTAAESLGLPQRTRGRACIMQLGKGFPKIDLTELSDIEGRAPLDNCDRGLVRLCLLAEGLPDICDRLKMQGVEFVSEPAPGEGGMVTLAVCRDPDGTLIELLEVHRDRWPRN